MATTSIHAIYTRPDQCLDYGMADKVGEYRDSIDDAIEYAINDKTGEVLYKTLTSFLYCNAIGVKDEFRHWAESGKHMNERKPRTKNGLEVVMWHLIQSFDGIECPPQTANEIGFRLAEEMFLGFPCVISTHTDTDNIHNHIMVCAWDMDGRKYSDDKANTRRIRKISDKLCEEYGLSVLEHTRYMKLINYRDEDGTARSYEPTDRKNRLIDERAGENAAFDIGDYRNTSKHEVHEQRRRSNKDTIQGDIDSLLPMVRSYEELLDGLREMGYTVNDRKKNGEWLKHISFIAPLTEKARRDCSLGDGVFYIRENLTKYIEDREAERISGGGIVGNEETDINLDGLAYFPDYEYGHISIEDLDEYYRVARNRSYDYEIVRRSTLETDHVRSIKRTNSEIVSNGTTTDTISKVRVNYEEAKKSKKKYVPDNETQEAVKRAIDELRSLRFVERHGIQSLRQAQEMCDAVRQQYHEAKKDHDQVDAIIRHLKDVLDLPDKIRDLDSSLDGAAGDASHISERMRDDISRLGAYKETVAKLKIDTPNGEAELRGIVTAHELRAELLRSSLDELLDRLYDHENCVNVLLMIGFDHIPVGETEIETTNPDVDGGSQSRAMGRGEGPDRM